MQSLLATCAAVVICLTQFTATASAAATPPQYDEVFYSGSNITYYNPQCADDSSSAKLVQLAGKDNVEKILNFFMRKGLSLAQAAGFVGNMQQESGLNPAIIQGGAIADDNYTPVSGVGFGLVQWTSGNRQLNLVGFIRGDGNHPGLGAGITNLSAQLEFTWHEVNESYPHVINALKTTQDPVVAAVIVHGRADSASGDQKYKDAMVALNNQRGYEISGDTGDAVVRVRGGTAQKVYDMYSDAPAMAGSTADKSQTPSGEGSDADKAKAVSTASGTPNATCDSSGQFGGGNLPETVKAYAWPEYSTRTDQQPAYAAAVAKAQGEGRYVGGAGGGVPGDDCGGFVTLAIYDSGWDKGYNNGDHGGPTTAQEAWLRDNWRQLTPEEVKNADKQTGDVAVNEDHTYMFVKGFGVNIASASLGGPPRAPMAGQESPTDSSFRWYRKK